MAVDGLKITLSGIGGGLTTDKNGKMLLPIPLVLQCPPLEQYSLVHAFNFGNYDTVDDDQYSRRGSRQLDTWQFDTLMLYLGADASGNYQPFWVPFPRNEPGGNQKRTPEWYVQQLRAIFVAGSPFKYVAAFSDSTVIHTVNATLTGFSEDYKFGEDDSIYLSGMSFQEWRDPRGKTTPPIWPAHVQFKRVLQPAWRWLAYDITKPNVMIKTKAQKTGTTFADLARHFYGNGALWRTIATANKCKGGSGDTPILTHWFPKTIKGGGGGTVQTSTKKLTIPKKPGT